VDASPRSNAVGPHKDLIGGWAAAARKNGLRFGVSVHASHTWMWYESAQSATSLAHSPASLRFVPDFPFHEHENNPPDVAGKGVGPLVTMFLHQIELVYHLRGCRRLSKMRFSTPIIAISAN